MELFNKAFNIGMHLMDNMELMKHIPDGYIDIILIDPPYKYLINQDLEYNFDEEPFFRECKRILSPKGFLIMFGRGDSFYRMNGICAALGLDFKEEIIWDKRYISSPMLPIGRRHETISIRSVDSTPLNKIKKDYLESKKHDLHSIITDIKRLNTALGNQKVLNSIIEFIKVNNIGEDNQLKIPKRVDLSEEYKYRKNNAAVTASKDGCRAVAVFNSIVYGMNLQSICYDTYNKEEEEIETIISCVRDHYTAHHPTQKPTTLLKALIRAALPKDKPIEEVVVFDGFGGSFSTSEAGHELGCKTLVCERLEKYYEIGTQIRLPRMLEKKQQTKLF
jgi:site-specific DNA-methyltransferase (adenine-specific)